MNDEPPEPESIDELLASLPDMNDDDTAEITKQHRAHGLRVADIKLADQEQMT